MRAFGIFSLVSALAATLCVSAAPAPAAGLASLEARDAVVPGGISSGSLLARSEFQTSPLDIVERELTPLPTIERRGGESCYAIIVDATAQIQLLIPKLDLLVAAHADVQAFVDILVEVQAIVVAAVAAIQILVNAHVTLAVFLGGKSIAEFVVVICAFIQIIILVCVKISAVVALSVQVIAVVIAAISAQIVIILQLCLQVSVVLVVAICVKVVLIANISILASVLAFALLHLI